MSFGCVTKHPGTQWLKTKAICLVHSSVDYQTTGQGIQSRLCRRCLCEGEIGSHAKGLWLFLLGTLVGDIAKLSTMSDFLGYF